MKRHADIITDVSHLRKFGNSMYVTIPKAMHKLLDWAPGQAVLIRAKGKRLLLESLLEHMEKAKTEHDQELATRS